jgi:hypothetical protein
MPKSAGKRSRHAAELVRDGALPPREKVLPERAAPSDEILPKTRQALVEAGRRGVRERRSIELASDPLRVERVTPFVKHGEQRVHKSLPSRTRRDAHVAERELRHERVNREIDASSLEVVSEGGEDLAPEIDERLTRRGMPKKRVVGGLTRGDCLDERDEAGRKRREDRAHLAGRRAVVVHGDQWIRAALAGGGAPSLLATEIERFLEQRAHGGKVVRRARDRPRRVHGSVVLVRLGDERCRDAYRPLVQTAGDRASAGSSPSGASDAVSRSTTSRRRPIATSENFS